MTSNPAFEKISPPTAPTLIFVCDHASNALPEGYGTLGLAPDLFTRHIAYDIGAADVTRAMAQKFSSPAILGLYSRLLIDLNRGADDPTLVMKLSDGAIIPGNAKVTSSEIETRIEKFYRPYHVAIAGEVARARQAGIPPIIISIHSFTPEWKGTPRPWQVGVLWSRKDGRLAVPLLAELRKETDLIVGDNQPYSGELDGDCMAQHALAHGLPHVLIEIRQDLIASRHTAELWAERLSKILERAITQFRRQEEDKRHMDPKTQIEIEAAAFRRLVAHLQTRTDVQNIDLMNLAGFCRNCLSNWFEEEAKSQGLQFSREAARERIYGMPYAEWKSKFQAEASAEQKAAFEISHKNHS